MKRTGWQIVVVPGLVPDEVFFEHLAHRRFPAGNFIRQPRQLDYLFEEPDVFHDVFGHVLLLMNPVMADYLQAYGVGGLRARELGVLTTGTCLLVDRAVRPGAAERRAGIITTRVSHLLTRALFRSMMPRPTVCTLIWSG